MSSSCLTVFALCNSLAVTTSFPQCGTNKALSYLISSHAETECIDLIGSVSIQRVTVQPVSDPLLIISLLIDKQQVAPVINPFNHLRRSVSCSVSCEEGSVSSEASVCRNSCFLFFLLFCLFSAISSSSSSSSLSSSFSSSSSSSSSSLSSSSSSSLSSSSASYSSASSSSPPSSSPSPVGAETADQS